MESKEGTTLLTLSKPILGTYVKQVWSYRRLWLPDLTVLCLVSAAAWFLARHTGLDLTIQDGLAGESDGVARWPAGTKPPWTWLRQFGPWPGIAMGIVSLALLIISLWWKRLHPYRIHFLFLVLVLLLGPGLLVNILAKPYFGRPRPKELQRYGGWISQYRVAFERTSPSQSRSFPSGHASTGFYFVALYFLFRRSGKIRRWFGLFVGLSLGSLIGYARMLAGGHYLSDVLWSCLFVSAVTFVLYYFLINVPAREDQYRISRMCPSAAHSSHHPAQWSPSEADASRP